MRVGRKAALDIHQFLPQLLRDLTGATGADSEMAFARMDTAHWRDDCGGSTGEGLHKLSAARVGFPVID